MNEVERVSKLAVNIIIYIKLKILLKQLSIVIHIYITIYIYDIICLTIYCLTYAYLVIML